MPFLITRKYQSICSGIHKSVKICAVAFADFLKPVEGILSDSLHILEIKFITVYIDESIALCDSLMCGNQIKCRPWGITKQFNTICDGFLTCLDMLTEVVNTIVIMYLFIFC